MADHGQLAYDYFFEGHNCAQCVAGAFAPEMGLTPETAMRMAAGFGGGFGRLREVCGGFSGLVLALGSLYGSAEPARKTELYTAVQELAAQYKQRNGCGSLICRELLGLEKAEGSPVASERTAEYYHKRPCPELVRLCAKILEEYIAAHPLPAKEAVPDETV